MEAGMQRRRIEELSFTASLGMLAERTVRATGRMLESEPLRDLDRPALEAAKGLLLNLGSSRVGRVPGPRSLVGDEGYLETVRAVESIDRASDSVAAFGAKLAASIDHGLTGKLAADDRELLVSVQTIFRMIGQQSLTRATHLGHTRREGRWRMSRSSIRS